MKKQYICPITEGSELQATTNMLVGSPTDALHINGNVFDNYDIVPGSANDAV